MNKSEFTREAVNFHLKVLKGFPCWSWNVWNILEKIPDGAGSVGPVKCLCCDNPKVEARVSHLLCKYFIGKFQLRRALRRGEEPDSPGKTGNVEELDRRFTSQDDSRKCCCCLFGVACVALSQSIRTAASAAARIKSSAVQQQPIKKKRRLIGCSGASAPC